MMHYFLLAVLLISYTMIKNIINGLLLIKQTGMEISFQRLRYWNAINYFSGYMMGKSINVPVYYEVKIHTIVEFGMIIG